MKNMLYISAILILLIITADKSYCLDLNKMTNQVSLRCPEGTVDIGDSEGEVLKRCGHPLRIVDRPNSGPIWIYHFYNDVSMFYLTILYGNLQRISIAPCSPNKSECFDVR